LWFIPRSRTKRGGVAGQHHLDHAELAMVAGGTLTEG
jgi:hypothetical protein